VFGLRRALQEAGAQSILMSLWAVPSAETQALMTAFYRHWLDDGMDKHAALSTAQADLRRSGKSSAYFWGGFVLVGL
jgi:CHAT domain-containing protein